MIQNIIHFMKVAKHAHLVNLERFNEGSDVFELYYEYVPFRMENWLLEVDSELITSLESQMIDLA